MHTAFVQIRRWANKRYIMRVCACMNVCTYECVLRSNERIFVFVYVFLCASVRCLVCRYMPIRAPGGTKTSTCSLNMNRLCVHRSLDLTPTGCPLVNSLVPVVFFQPYHFFLLKMSLQLTIVLFLLFFQVYDQNVRAFPCDFPAKSTKTNEIYLVRNPTARSITGNIILTKIKNYI